jgi:dissimilatory sulfite reductase (desulfoviridin) alpha/beta subunit
MMMEWTPEAEAAVKKVPFFVRKKVKQHVEVEARSSGRHKVVMEDVKAAKARYLSRMSSDVKGYQIDICFGPSGCPNRANNGDELLEGATQILREADLLSFLKDTIKGDLKYHHEFRVTISECPNACSQPQIKDIGIIGARLPSIIDVPCSECAACIEHCRENAVALNEDRPLIDQDKCLYCGKCIDVCPTGTIAESQKGFRIQVGGKLGRHPRLARELPVLYDQTEVIRMVNAAVRFYKQKSRHGERFGDLINRVLCGAKEDLPEFLKKGASFSDSMT